MHTIFTWINTVFSTVFERWQALSIGRQRQLDTFFHALQSKNEAPDFADALTYAKRVFMISVLRMEIHVTAIIVMIIAFSTVIFLPYVGLDWLTRTNLILVAMLFGITTGLSVLFLLLLLHIRYNLSLIWVTALHAILCSLIFSYVEPIITLRLQGYESRPFSYIFPPTFLIYAVSDLFIYWQNRKRVCFRHFCRQHTKEALATLLPVEKRGDVYLMSAADHYVEMFTENGSHMHRMTMKTAIEKADPNAGTSVHRSHWVAYKAMVALEKEGERYFLRLRSGQKVPVSRNMVAEVEQHLDESRLAAQ